MTHYPPPGNYPPPPEQSGSGSSKSGGSKMGWVVLIVAVVFALICGAIVIADTSGGDPTDYIKDKYKRASELDESDGGAAYVSTKSPEKVADDIDDAVDAVDVKRASDGARFLQYREHIVAITPFEGGSKIYVDDYRRGHSRYTGHSSYGFIFIGSSGWSRTPPSGGFRGGGSGGGK